MFFRYDPKESLKGEFRDKPTGSKVSMAVRCQLELGIYVDLICPGQGRAK